MEILQLKPSQKAVTTYYRELNAYARLGVKHEMAVRDAFQALLKDCCKQVGLTFIGEWKIRRKGRAPLSVDGAIVGFDELARGYWEAKDERDDLAKEVKAKFAVGYPKDNIIFQSPSRAILYQNGRQVLDEDITQPEKLVGTLKQFFEYRAPQIAQWEEAAAKFQERVPELADSVFKLIEKERKDNKNKKFIKAFAEFSELARASINPNISDKAVEEMLIQHLLTERIFRNVFDNPDFANNNIIAVEIEKVIRALTSQTFSRTEFLKSNDYFYRALEETAATIEDFSQKQSFLNSVYERFFQGFSVKLADTHGIVYTPQPIVNFMVRSVEDILRQEFGKSLSDAGVHILDPFVGTGNFMIRVMQEIKRTRLQEKYANELHCNEVMLLPYYIASMNIEHTFFDLTNTYQPFEGICLVDTFELAEGKQGGLFTEENTARIERQKRQKLFVIIGNPPYNVGQVNENDNNKNRKYKEMDKRVSETYAKASKATNKNALSDPYVKAIRWASDKIKDTGEGVIAFVTNNSFLDQIAFDGMRQQLAQDFDAVYVLDLGGNVRKNPKLSGTTHNVFGIQVGVSINIFVKKRRAE
jgi:predicted helicase